MPVEPQSAGSPTNCSDDTSGTSGDFGWPRRLIAVVEIALHDDGRLRKDLLRNVYGASQSGVIGLALTDVSAAFVDEVMDEIVPLFPLSIPGIRYVSTSDRSLLVWVLGLSDAAFGDTDTFRYAAIEAGFHTPLPFSWQFEIDGAAFLPSADPFRLAAMSMLSPPERPAGPFERSNPR